MKLGIALGGGGAKGLAHIGVLEALEQQKIKPQFVAGTSIGAIIGAIYCLEGSARNLSKITRGILESQEFKKLELDKFYTTGATALETFKKKLFEKYYFGTLFFKKSLVKIEATEKLLTRVFGEKKFSDLKIPFVCNSLDINSGNEIIFSSGLLYKAVWASCAIPGVFPALNENENIFVDGGTINNIPIEPLIGIGAKNIIAVYLGETPKFNTEPSTGFYITQRALSFMKYHLDQRILKLADCIIKPDVAYHHWADFTDLDGLIQKGRNAVAEKIDEIKKITTFWYTLKKNYFFSK
ncbi:MAG: patatin-like phospholipase family protein [candidate division WOR-3 bacterium]